jgi:hypothetical protein
MERPTLNDPAEYAIIKSIYFKETLRGTEDLDPMEKLERMESKQRNHNKSSR